MKKKALHVKGTRVPLSILPLKGWIDVITKKARVDPESGLLESSFISKLQFHCNEAFRCCAIDLENDINSYRLEAATLLTENRLNILRDSHMPESVPDDVRTPKTKTGTTEMIPESGGEETAEVSGETEDLSSKPYERRKLPVTAGEARIARMEAREAARRAEARTLVAEARAKARARAEEELAKAKEAREQAEKKKDESMIRLTQIREQMISKELITEERLAATSAAIRARLCAYAHGAVRGAVSDSHIPEIAYDCWLDEYRKAHEDLDRRISEALRHISC